MQKSSEKLESEPKQFFYHKNGMKTAFDMVRPSEEKSDTILVYFHGNQLSCRDRKAKFALAKATENNITGVAVDNFGDGDSSGVRGEISPLDWKNQAREFVLEYLVLELGFKNFYLAGMSVGGFICSLLMRDEPQIMDKVLGVLLISPAFDFPLYKIPLFTQE